MEPFAEKHHQNHQSRQNRQSHEITFNCFLAVMLSLVSTWMGDRLGTLGAVGHKLFLLLLVLVPF